MIGDKKKAKKQDLNLFKKSNISKENKNTKISTSVQKKEKLIRTIDNLLDFQLITQKRIISYKKEEEKRGNKSEEPKAQVKLLEIPVFLQKTKERIADYSKIALKQKIAQKEKLKEKMEKLDNLKTEAQKEISKLHQKKFDPKLPFNMSFKEKSENLSFEEKEFELFDQIKKDEENFKKEGKNSKKEVFIFLINIKFMFLIKS